MLDVQSTWWTSDSFKASNTTIKVFEFYFWKNSKITKKIMFWKYWLFSQLFDFFFKYMFIDLEANVDVYLCEYLQFQNLLNLQYHELLNTWIRAFLIGIVQTIAIQKIIILYLPLFLILAYILKYYYTYS